MKYICKIMLLFICCALVFSLITNTAFASGENSYCWYIKRNGQLRPVLQKEQNIILNYNAYYRFWTIPSGWSWDTPSPCRAERRADAVDGDALRHTPLSAPLRQMRV